VPLPIKPLATSSIDIEGVAVPIRSLSRHEVVSLTDFDGRTSEAEVFMLSRSAGVSEEEAQEWRDKVDATTAGELLDAIAVLSGIKRGKDKGKV
jgi:hypothetical protein